MGLPTHLFGIIRNSERHERVCGCSHSHQRRRDAPARTSGCNLDPALDLDLDSLLPVVPVRWTGAPVATCDQLVMMEYCTMNNSLDETERG
jgi:hypothetical protein